MIGAAPVGAVYRNSLAIRGFRAETRGVVEAYSREILLTILSVSIMLQLSAAVVAVLQVRRTKAYLPWLFISTAITLMAVRRITTLTQIILAWRTISIDSNFLPELIALLISILMVLGLYKLGPIFRVLQGSVDEKELLLRESLHNTKNNLQALLSMIRIQESFLTEPSARFVAEEMRRRVQVFALLQEELFRVGGEREMVPFFERLLHSIVEGYEDQLERVEFVTEIAELEMSDRELLYCGLVANEALTNAFKYAVPMVEKPKILVRLTADEMGRLLRIEDNGPGIAVKPENLQGTSFGFTFLNSLSGKDGWQITIAGEKGTVVEFRF